MWSLCRDIYIYIGYPWINVKKPHRKWHWCTIHYKVALALLPLGQAHWSYTSFSWHSHQMVRLQMTSLLLRCLPRTTALVRKEWRSSVRFSGCLYSTTSLDGMLRSLSSAFFIVSIKSGEEDDRWRGFTTFCSCGFVELFDSSCINWELQWCHQVRAELS